jgi:two-component system, cell cycle response regulator CpdR
MTIRSILVVDDDPDTLKAMRQVLEPKGYAVTVAIGGQEALRSLGRKPVDLVITDIVMPDGDGFELVAALRKNFPDTRVVAVSGGGNLSPDTYLVIARGFGVDAVLQKPVMHDELITAIKGVETRPWGSSPRDRS